MLKVKPQLISNKPSNMLVLFIAPVRLILLSRAILESFPFNILPLNAGFEDFTAIIILIFYYCKVNKKIARNLKQTTGNLTKGVLSIRTDML